MSLCSIFEEGKRTVSISHTFKWKSRGHLMTFDFSVWRRAVLAKPLATSSEVEYYSPEKESTRSPRVSLPSFTHSLSDSPATGVV